MDPRSYETIVGHWFPLIGERINKALSGETMDEYVRTFRRAQVTMDGLEEACRDVFNTAKGFTWPEPEAFVSKARQHAARLRVESRDGKAVAPEIVEIPETREKRRELAEAWAKENPDKYKEIAREITAEHCARARVEHARDLPLTRKLMRDEELIEVVAQYALRALMKKAAEANLVNRPVPPDVEKQRRVQEKKRQLLEQAIREDEERRRQQEGAP